MPSPHYYPTQLPTNKHDLVGPLGFLFDNDNNNHQQQQRLLDHSEYHFTTPDELFHALEEPVVVVSDHNRHEFDSCYVYSYPDSPRKPGPLSRLLIVVGVMAVDHNATSSNSLVRKLIPHYYDNDNHQSAAVPDCMHKCTLAVKLMDTPSKRQQFPPNDVTNSDKFAHLLQRLRREQAVLILGLDKLGRFGILCPMIGNEASGEDTPTNEYAAHCFVGNLRQVKEYLSSSSSQSHPSSSSTLISSYSNGFDDQQQQQSSTSSDALWQPPGEEESSSNGLWQPPTADDAAISSWHQPSQTDESSTTMTTTSHGQKRSLEEEFHADSGAAAADAFYSGLTRSLDTRADSRLYHMRAFNGWVKATQIQELDPKCSSTSSSKKKSSKSGRNAAKNQQGPLRVLDLACGKGGDLGKWVLHDRGISNYVGVDVARGSLMDAAIRARQMRKKLPRCTFTCADLGSDVPGRLRSNQHKVPQKLLSWSLQKEKNVDGDDDDPKFELVRGGGIALDDKFDVVSIQFAIHYMMSSRKRARRFFQTVSQLLEIGGNLIATTIDARIAVGLLMNLGLDLHMDGDKRDFGSKEPLVQVGGGACRIRFDDETVVRLFKMQKIHNKKNDQKSSEPDGPTATKRDDGDENDYFGLQYTFTLVEGSDHAKGVGDAVNLPEWLTPLPALESLAKEAGLELVYAQNFHDFYAERMDASTFPLAHSALYNMKVLNRDGSISAEEWEISRMYAAVKFRKVRESTMQLDDDEEEVDDDDDHVSDVDEPPQKGTAAAAAPNHAPVEIKPELSQKLLPMAMMKAKKMHGADEWQALSSEEKKRLIQIELEKLAAAAMSSS